MTKKQQGHGGRHPDGQAGPGAKDPDGNDGASQGGHGGHGGAKPPDGGNEPPLREPYDDPDEHLEIERRRFAGGLAPTPERYALAREQWYRLPGALQRPTMDPPSDTATPDEAPVKRTGTP